MTKRLLSCLLPLLTAALFVSCRKYMKYERWIENNSADTLIVINPDFDSVYTIAPGEKAMIHDYERLDKKKETPDSCAWLGDTLFIHTLDGDTCHVSVKKDGNWTTTTTTVDKHNRIKACTLTLDDEDF